jgi:hypothetical protein
LAAFIHAEQAVLRHLAKSLLAKHHLAKSQSAKQHLAESHDSIPLPNLTPTPSSDGNITGLAY